MRREVIKWIQSLDLTDAVKNPQRDVANGYLFAEVLSRYYPTLVSMHSFHREIGLSYREINWQLILKILSKTDLAINIELIYPVKHYQAGAADALLESLYAALTKQKPVQATAHHLKEQSPNYTKPTATTKLKDHMLDIIADETTREIKAIQIVENHDSGIRESSRLLPGGVDAEASLDQTKGLTPHVKEEPVEVKQIKVKTVAGAQLMAQQRQKLAATIRSTDESKPKSRSTAEAATNPTVKQALSLVKSFTAHVLARLVGDLPDAESTFVGIAVASPDLVSDETAAECMQELVKRADGLGDICTKSPAEFWKLWEAIFYPALNNYGADSKLFPVTVSAVSSLLSRILLIEAATAESIAITIVLRGSAELLTKQTDKCLAIVAGVYSSFSQSSAAMRYNILRELRNALGSSTDPLGSFVVCMHVFAKLDLENETLDDRTLDVYHHYVTSGLAHANPRVRAGAVAALAILVPRYHTDKLTGLLPSITLLRSPVELPRVISFWAMIIAIEDLRSAAVEELPTLLAMEKAVSAQSLFDVGKRLGDVPELSGVVATALITLSEADRDTAFGRSVNKNDAIGLFWDCRDVIRCVMQKLQVTRPGSAAEKAAIEIVAFSLSRIGSHASIPAAVLTWYLPRLVHLLKTANVGLVADLRTILVAAVKADDGVSAALQQAALDTLRVVLEADLSYDKASAVFREDLIKYRDCFAAALEILKSENADLIEDSAIRSLLSNT